MHDATWPGAENRTARRIREHDWASTVLGGIDGWSSRRRAQVELVIDAKRPMYVALSADLIIIYNEAYRGLLAGNHPAAFGRPMREVFAENWPELEQLLAEVMAGQPKDMENVRFSMPWRKAEPEGWFTFSLLPIRDAVGEIAGILASVVETTEKVKFEAVLRDREEWLRNAVEVGKLGLWDWDIRSDEVRWSDEHFRMEGYAVDEVKPSYDAWAERIHPDDRAETEVALKDAIENGTAYEHEFRVLHPDGEVRWLHGRGSFFHSADGETLRMVGAMADVTSRREMEDHHKALIAELQHRTMNLIGVVRALAARTARGSADIADFTARFETRLQALSRAQRLLSRHEGYDRVAFDELLDAEFSGVGPISERVSLTGPTGVRLASSTVQLLALALHELTNNAVKHGALARPSGRLVVNWSLETANGKDEPRLHIDWRESGVTISPTDCRTNGTGRELVETALPYQIAAETTFTLEPDGLRCTISLPLAK